MTDLTNKNDFNSGRMIYIPKRVIYLLGVAIGTSLCLFFGTCYLLWNTQKRAEIYSEKIDSMTSSINIWIVKREQSLKKFNTVYERNKKHTISLSAQLVDEELQPIRLGSTYLLYSNNFGDSDEALRRVDSTGRFKIKIGPNELLQKSLLIYRRLDEPAFSHALYAPRKIYGTYDPKTETMLFVLKKRKSTM